MFPGPDPPNSLIVTFRKHQSDSVISLHYVLHGLPIALEIKSNHLLESYRTLPVFPHVLLFHSHSQCHRPSLSGGRQLKPQFTWAPGMYGLPLNPQTGRGCFSHFPLPLIHSHSTTFVPTHCHYFASCLSSRVDKSSLELASSF